MKPWYFFNMDTFYGPVSFCIIKRGLTMFVSDYLF